MPKTQNLSCIFFLFILYKFKCGNANFWSIMGWCSFYANFNERVRGFLIAAHTFARTRKGSHFRANVRQTQPRVRNFGKNLQRVRTFGHSFAKNSKGFALLTTIRKRFALLGIAGRNFERVCIFRALASSCQKHEI